MDTKQIAEQFMEGYDCSQVVLRHFARELGISEDEANRVSACFGGGMQLGSVWRTISDRLSLQCLS